MLRHLKFGTVLLSFILSEGMLSATESTPSPSEPILPDEYKDIPPGRKHAPSRNIIYFYYDNVTGMASFALPSGVSSISIVAESEDGDTEYGFVTDENPVWYVQLKSTTYHLTCISDSGKSYSADISI